MATTTEEKVAFSERLKAAMGRKRKPLATPTALANAFNLKWLGAPITTQAAQKWLQGTATPTPDKIAVLAEMFAVPEQWLRFGIAVPEARGTRVGERSLRGFEQLNAGALSAEELRLIARLRAMPEARRELVKRMVSELSLDHEMWVRD